MSALAWLLPLLRCPVCRARLTMRVDAGAVDEGLLEHAEEACQERYPVIGGIPRLVTGASRAWLADARREWFEATDERRALAIAWRAAGTGADTVVRGFDDEWSRFDRVGTPELAAVFAQYFDLVPAERFSADQTVLDAGCGAGRWAREVAVRGPRVIAADLGLSVELAQRNTGRSDRVGCVQLDLRELPLGEASVDWAYSLGVLHHLEEPARALGRIVGVVRPGGLVLTYLYYALDGRGPLFRAVFRGVNGVRRLTSALPRPAVVAFARAIAALVYWPLARLSALLASVGARALADALPLSFYRGRPFSLMANDSLDRFGTRIELRFTRADMERLLRGAGLDEVVFSDAPPYWHAVASR